MDYTFSVLRSRSSATQGEATVLLNGCAVITFGDTIGLVKDGAAFYGENIGGWASTKSDGDFVFAALFHPYDKVYNHSAKVREVLKSEVG